MSRMFVVCREQHRTGRRTICRSRMTSTCLTRQSFVSMFTPAAALTPAHRVGPSPVRWQRWRQVVHEASTLSCTPAIAALSISTPVSAFSRSPTMPVQPLALLQRLRRTVSRPMAAMLLSWDAYCSRSEAASAVQAWQAYWGPVVVCCKSCSFSRWSSATRCSRCVVCMLLVWSCDALSRKLRRMTLVCCVDFCLLFLLLLLSFSCSQYVCCVGVLSALELFVCVTLFLLLLNWDTICVVCIAYVIRAMILSSVRSIAG